MSAPIRAEGWQDTGCLLPDLHAKQSGDLFISSVASSVLVEPRLIGPVLDLGTVDATTQVRGLSIDVDWGILDFLDFLVNGIVGSFSGTISSALQSNFDYFVEASLPDVLGDLLGSLELHRSATVNGSDVAYEGPLDTLKWGSDGSATLGLGVQVRPSGPAAGSADVSGAIRSASTGTPTWATSYDMGVAVSDDFLNQTLWAAWQAGSFATDDVSASTGQTYAGLVGGLTPQLPPVVVAGSGEHILDVQWGDLVLEGTADPAVLGLPGFESGNPVEVEAHVSLVGGLDLGYDGENRVLEGWPGEPDVRVELHLAAGAVLDEAALRESIAAAVADYAEVALLGAVGAIPVPYVDLSGVDGVAAGTTVGLLSATITREGAYTKLTGPAGN
jgi:hypothetical protein